MIPTTLEYFTDPPNFGIEVDCTYLDNDSLTVVIIATVSFCGFFSG